MTTSDAPLNSSASQPLPVAPAASAKPVERLFPFVLRSRGLIVGRDNLRRSRSKLHFVLITRDISESSRAELLSDFAPYPIVQHFAAEDLEKHFNIRGAKVVGFTKSGLAQSIYAELKQHRINKPVATPKPAGSLPAPPSVRRIEPAVPSRRRDRP